VYDVARKETFDSLNMWLTEVEQFSMGGGKEVVKLLVGNKIDQQRVVPREVAVEYASSKGMLFMEASAKTKDGIAQVFSEVVQMVREPSQLHVHMRNDLLFIPRFFKIQRYCRIRDLQDLGKRI
jgi:Ras-related protein Rab-18